MIGEIEAVLSGSARWAVVHGEALATLATMLDASVDAIVTDPPAGIGFMGAEWDTPSDGGGARGAARRAAFVEPLRRILYECYRVAKPGARLFCWAIPRTCGWTQMAIEDAGWLVENAVGHLFGSGFPKGKGQLKPAMELWFLARKPGGKVPPLQIDECRVAGAPRTTHADGNIRGSEVFGGGQRVGVLEKGAVGRWPPNLVLSHAEGCKQVGTREIQGTAPIGRPSIGAPLVGQGIAISGIVGKPRVAATTPTGRETVAAWDCVDGCPVKALDEQSGRLAGRGNTTATRRTGGKYNAFGEFRGCERDAEHWHDNIGGTASRFFPQFEPDPLDGAPFLYAAKASRRERNAGCEGLPERPVEATRFDGAGGLAERIGSDGKRTPKAIPPPVSNHHPTVKSQALMRWLCRLITPPNGAVLDPFNGSGSTGVAALTEGLRYVGIEREQEYVEIARRRCGHVKATGQVISMHRERPATAPAPAPARQLALAL